MSFKTVFLMLGLLGSLLLQAKEYPVLAMGVERVSGSYIGGWERDRFLDGLEKALARRGHIVLTYRAPYLLRVSISGYSRNFGRGTGKFLGSRQYRFKQSVRLQARYAVFDRSGYELYHGTLPYNVRMNTGSSISYEDAMMKARENMLEGLGERVGEKINDRFRFMVDFEDQMGTQYGRAKPKKHHSSYSRSGLARLPSGYSLDFESGKVGKKNSWGDLKWEALPGKVDMHFFKPLGKARFAVVKGRGYNHIDKQYAQSKKLSSVPRTAFDFDKTFSKGAVFVFQTKEGHYGKMKILGFTRRGEVEHYALRIEWKLF